MMNKNIKNPYSDDQSVNQNTQINLSSDIAMQVFEILRIVLDIGLESDKEIDTHSKDQD